MPNASPDAVGRDQPSGRLCVVLVVVLMDCLRIAPYLLGQLAELLSTAPLWAAAMAKVSGRWTPQPRSLALELAAAKPAQVSSLSCR